MLVGLPAFALVLALLRDMGDKNRLILAGVVTGLVYQFHNVAFFCCWVAFAVCLLFNFRKLKLSYLYFAVPSVLALPFILGGGSSFNLSISASFIMDYAHNAYFPIYYLLNLGVPLILIVFL